MSSFKRLGLLLAWILTSCAPRPAPVSPAQTEPPTEPPAATASPPSPRDLSADEDATGDVAWPDALLVAQDDGPVLFRHSDADAVGYAWVRGGVAIQARGGVSADRVRARVDGPLRLRGWAPVARLEAVVLRRGRLRGTPVFLTPGDRVRLRGAERRTAWVEAVARIGHPSLERTDPFVGELPLNRLGAAPAGVGDGPTPGRPVLLRGAAELRARPGGEVVYRLPALEPALVVTVLREEEAWVGARIGAGPYLVGYLPRDAVALRAGTSKQTVAPEVLDPWRRRPPSTPPPRSEVRDPWARPSPALPSGPAALPAPLRREVVRPVWRVAAGARVRVEGATVAVFREDGWAVELERHGDVVRVVGAVDEDALVRGEVSAGALRALPSSDRPSSDRPSSDRPSSDRPSSEVREGDADLGAAEGGEGVEGEGG